MNLLEKFNHAMGFTRTESRVVLFLVITFVLGIGIKYLRESPLLRPAFDYAASDSEFAARSESVVRSGTAASETHRAAMSDSGPGARAPERRIVDINHATKEELTQLPGIGPTIADRIILYRQDHGPFESVGQLTLVRGIGKKKLERLAPLCSVGE